MFAYLIIAVELTILYLVFWTLFLREPKTYKISGDPWGTYAQQKGHGNCTCGAQDAFSTTDSMPEFAVQSSSGTWQHYKNDAKLGPTLEAEFEFVRSSRTGFQRKAKVRGTEAQTFLANLKQAACGLNVRLPR